MSVASAETLRRATETIQRLDGLVAALAVNNEQEFLSAINEMNALVEDSLDAFVQYPLVTTTMRSLIVHYRMLLT